MLDTAQVCDYALFIQKWIRDNRLELTNFINAYSKILQSYRWALTAPANQWDIWFADASIYFRYSDYEMSFSLEELADLEGTLKKTQEDADEQVKKQKNSILSSQKNTLASLVTELGKTQEGKQILREYCDVGINS